MNGRRKLARYLKAHGESQRAFERRLGVKPGAVSRYLSDVRCPDGRVACLIESATAGEVPAASWYRPALKARRSPSQPSHA